MISSSNSSYLPPKYYTKSHRYWMLGHVYQHWKKLLIIGVMTVLSIILQTLIPIIFGQAIDKAIPERDSSKLTYYALLINALGVLRGFLSYISSILNDQVAQNVEMQVRLELFENLSKKNMDFFNKSRVGDLMSQATQDTQNLTFAVSPGIRSLVSAVFGILATAIAMVYLSSTLSIIFLFIIPLYVVFLVRFANNLQPVSLERQERLAKINTMIQENITGIRVVRTFGAEETEARVFKEDIRAYEGTLIKRGAISASFIPSLILGVVTALIFLGGVYLIEQANQGNSELSVLGLFSLPLQALSIGELIAFMTLTGLLLFPTNILRFLLDATMLGFAGAQRIFATLTTEAKLEASDQSILENVKGEIRFSNVTFSYDRNETKALNDFTLHIKEGETVAIIGPTGSGKSTVGRLLHRLYDIDSGSIEIDGTNIRDVDLNQLRRIVGIIEQDVYLFSTTIKANIAYGVFGIEEEKIIEAAKTAQAHEFISQFKDGYDTIVGERGVTLSGGQKQRVAMARTFITNPKILIMDDSTSAVDAETESKIQKALGKLLTGRTSIIVTHRLSTLRHADKVVFMRLGRIEKMGTHEELLRTFVPYREIFKDYLELPPLEDGS